VQVLPTPHAGLGAFAACDADEEEFICQYRGDALTLDEVNAKYLQHASKEPEYLFSLGDGMYIDGESSDHFSRYINHNENGNIAPRIVNTPDGVEVHFFAIARIRAGDELTFDYGVEYWAARSISPAAGTDSRSLWLSRLKRSVQRNARGITHLYNSLLPLAPVVIALLASGAIR